MYSNRTEQIYVRKLFDHDLTHEVSITTEIVTDFFENQSVLKFYKADDIHQEYTVTINNATDPRFGGHFVSMYADKNLQVGDFILIKKISSDRFELSTCKRGDSIFNFLNNIFAHSKTKRHAMLLEETPNESVSTSLPPFPLQQIFYGAPGTGKSYRIKEIVEHYPKENIFRTTFHPDSDYSTFVGCYKPTKVKKPVRDMAGKTALDDKKNEIFEDTITYSFVPQAFLKAYIRAWNLLDSGQPVFLIIEEINRGNCAQIFGDLFQLLDRRQDGYSVYPIKADTDLTQYLNGIDADGNDILTNYEGIADGELNLPPNLYIWGTMNTSDQSLFPIDSAFKRRWNWKYIKISDAKLNWGIQDIQDNNSWYDFIEQINKIIIQITNSADKQLGYFFCQPDLSADQDKKNTISLQRFVDKVVFYLWNDVFKDNTFGDTNLFVDDSGNAISFPDFYDNTDKVNQPTTLAFIRRVMQWGKSSAELQQDSE